MENVNNMNEATPFINPQWLLDTAKEYAVAYAANKWLLLAHNAFTILSNPDSGMEAVQATAKEVYGMKPVKQRSGSTSYTLRSAGREHVKIVSYVASKVVEITAARRECEAQYKEEKINAPFTEYFVAYFATVLQETYKTLGTLAGEAQPDKAPASPEVVAKRESAKAQAAQKAAATAELLGKAANDTGKPVEQESPIQLAEQAIAAIKLLASLPVDYTTASAIIGIHNAMMTKEVQDAIELASLFIVSEESAKEAA